MSSPYCLQVIKSKCYIDISITQPYCFFQDTDSEHLHLRTFSFGLLFRLQANLMLSKQRSRAELQMLLWSTFAADNRVFTTTTGALPSECLFRLKQPTVNSIWWFSCTRTVLKGLMQQCGQRYFSFPIFATYPSVR